MRPAQLSRLLVLDIGRGGQRISGTAKAALHGRRFSLRDCHLRRTPDKMQRRALFGLPPRRRTVQARLLSAQIYMRFLRLASGCLRLFQCAPLCACAGVHPAWVGVFGPPHPAPPAREERAPSQRPRADSLSPRGRGLG
jgi:hypothetical protein